MVLLLGKHDAITEYMQTVLQIDDPLNLLCCPSTTAHHSEYGEYVDVIRDEQPPAITTQNLEMLDILLASDLDFGIIRVRRYGDEIKTANHTKEEVLANRKVWNFDPRD